MLNPIGYRAHRKALHTDIHSKCKWKIQYIFLHFTTAVPRGDFHTSYIELGAVVAHCAGVTRPKCQLGNNINYKITRAIKSALKWAPVSGVSPTSRYSIEHTFGAMQCMCLFVCYWVNEYFAVLTHCNLALNAMHYAREKRVLHTIMASTHVRSVRNRRVLCPHSSIPAQMRRPPRFAQHISPHRQ